MVATGERTAGYAARLDPRAKLAVQVAAAALVLASPRAGLAVVVALALAACAAARVDPLATLWEARAIVPLLVAAPVVESLSLSTPWVVPSDAVAPAFAVARVPPLYLLGAAYAASTTPRESRAAVTWLVPGRAGIVLGAGVELLFRLLPRMRADLASARRAANARLLDQRSALERIRVIGVTGVARAFRRADALARGLRARAFSTNPTLPALALSRADAPPLCLSALLLVAALGATV